MKRLILTITLAIVAAFGAAYGAYTPGYYNRMDGKMKEELKSAVKQCVRSHERLNYGQLPGYWQYTDVYPELYNGARRWWDMYSDKMSLIYEGQDVFASFRSNNMNREHSIPKSWWKVKGDVEYTPAYSDLWNLYPSDAAANSAKLNYPFGLCETTDFDNGVTKVGRPRNGYGGGASNVFEPADEYKGDFARSIFYMACVYDDLQWAYTYMFHTQSYPTLSPWAMDMLLQWSRRDPVSQKEIDRNNMVEQYQGNRNPFIDFPELCEYIWGVRTMEKFVIADQEVIDPTPPITGDPTLTAPVNGEAMDFGQIAVGHGVTNTLVIEGANFTSPLSVRIVGQDRNYFHIDVTEIPAVTLNTNGGYLLDITYLPETEGKHEARLTLYDGGLTGSVAVTLSGESLPVPSMETLTALSPTDITESGYTARWSAPEGIADYYTLTRVRYIGSEQESETYETGETEYRISDRDPSVPETYTVSYSRLGLTSPESNTIYVAADGVNAVQTEVPFRCFAEAEGILILTGDGEPVRGLVVTDMAGRVYFRGDVRHGELLPVPQGAYILTAPGHRPQRLMR